MKTKGKGIRSMGNVSVSEMLTPGKGFEAPKKKVQGEYVGVDADVPIPRKRKQ